MPRIPTIGCPENCEVISDSPTVLMIDEEDAVESRRYLKVPRIPRFATVGGAEDSALGVGAVGVAQRGDEDDVRIAGMDDDRAGVARVF